MSASEYNKICIDHIIWQPQFKCINHCKGCYIKDSKVSKYQGSINLDIIDLIFDSEKVKCEQFTLSIDNFIHKQDELINAIKEVWKRYENTTKEKPALCITLYDYNTLVRLVAHLNMTIQQFLTPVSILSLSNFPASGRTCEEFKEHCTASKTILGYNKVITQDVKDNQVFNIGCRYADQVYLVLHKNPLGEEQDKCMISYWRQAIEVVNKSKGPATTLILDSCVIDSTKQETAFKCSAGLRKVTIWPNGTVSGCPYDTNHIVNPNQEEGAVANNLSNLVNYTRCHPMKFCMIIKAFVILNSNQVNTHQVNQGE
jgi:hypothetical protein